MLVSPQPVPSVICWRQEDSLEWIKSTDRSFQHQMIWLNWNISLLLDTARYHESRDYFQICKLQNQTLSVIYDTEEDIYISLQVQ